MLLQLLLGETTSSRRDLLELDLDTAELHSAVTGQLVQRNTAQFELRPVLVVDLVHRVDRQHVHVSAQPTTVGVRQPPAGVAVARVAAFDDECASDAGEVGDLTEGGDPLLDEAVPAGGAGGACDGALGLVVYVVVRRKADGGRSCVGEWDESESDEGDELGGEHCELLGDWRSD